MLQGKEIRGELKPKRTFLSKISHIFVACVAVFLFTVGLAYAANNCTGATYYDSDTDTCINCPDHYDYNTTAGKTAITDCQISCAAGTYINAAALLPGGYTTLEYIQTSGSQYIHTGISSDGFGLKTVAAVEWPESITNGEQAVVGVLTTGTYEVYFQPTRNGLYRGSNERADINMSITPDVRYVITSEMTSNRITHDINGTTAVVNKTLSNANVTNITLFCHNRSYYLKARVYYVKIWQNGVLIRDMVPARRNSDSVLGMYDTVNDVFYTNAGTGTFTAGSDSGAKCENVGGGYWSAASVVNYGSAGTRTACPAGTSTNGVANASSCTPCAGATYADSMASATCTACPNGYNANTTAGKTAVTQCQISCPAGTWTGEYTELEYIHFDKTNYIDTGLKTNTDVQQVNGRLWADARMYPTGNREEQIIAGGGHFWMGIDNDASPPHIGYGAANSDKQTSAYPSGSHCIYDLDVKNNTYTVYDIDNENYIVNLSSLSKGTDKTTAVIGVGSYQAGSSKAVMDLYRIKIYNNEVLVFDGVPARRNIDGEIGLYDTVSDTFKPRASGGNAFTAGNHVGGFGGQCVNVGAGYYAAASVTNYGSASTRTACVNAPTNASYTAAGTSANCPWACNSGYTESNGSCIIACNGVMYAGGCHALCPENKMLRVGNVSYPAFADNTDVLGPMFHIKDENNQICYVFTEPDAGKTGHALKVLYNGTVYRAIDPR